MNDRSKNAHHPPTGALPAQEELSSLISGFHAVREALMQRRVRISELWVAEGKRPARIGEILKMARDMGIPILFKNPTALSRLLPEVVHQGVLAVASRFLYTPLEGIVAKAGQGPGPGLLVAADHITDEGNLGALIRTSAFFGAHGLIIPKDRSAAVSPMVLKRSSGAWVNLPLARVVNLTRALDYLDKKGYWMVGAAPEAPLSLYDFDWRRDLVLIVGNEEYGMSHAIRERCHQLVTIPSSGAIESLNVSVAAGVILSEIARQRGPGPTPEQIGKDNP